MSLLNEAAREELEKELEEIDELFEQTQEPQYRLSDFIPNFDFIFSETGSGSVEDYMEHPLNGANSRGVAQMLRGFTGLCGSLNYAVIDITL